MHGCVWNLSLSFFHNFKTHNSPGDADGALKDLMLPFNAYSMILNVNVNAK